MMRGLPLLMALGIISLSAAAAEPRKSGFEYMSPATQAMQKDDTQNPAMLWVKDGEALWNKDEGGAASCASCHGDAAASMRGVAAPSGFDAEQRPPGESHRAHQPVPAELPAGRRIRLNTRNC
jgi:hypothetical protein